MRTRSTIMTSEHDSALVSETSLLPNGEVCWAIVRHSPCMITDARRSLAGVVGDSRSGREDARKCGRSCWVRSVFMVGTHPKSRQQEFRAPIVVRKRGNARGAKGCRKANG